MKQSYTIGLYYRLSQEDDNDGESDSIANQRDLLNDFVQNKPEFKDCKVIEFIDDGYSGTNFDRPGVKELIEKVKKGAINCILVKDFSRFGRNYIEVGDYLEQVFPFLGVRFISVNNNYDSEVSTSITGLDVAFNNLIYDLYSKDLSHKVREAKKTKMKKGDYISSFAIYGYKKSKDNKNQLEIDDNAAEVVKRIFDMALKGITTSNIAKALNDENILTPHMYKRRDTSKVNWYAVKKENIWTKATIIRILMDARYTGSIVHGKRSRFEVGNKKTKKLSDDEWIVVPNKHEAIVSVEEFNQIQGSLKRINRPSSSNSIRLLTGKVKCGVCKHALRRRTRYESAYYYCITKDYISNCKCMKGSINEEKIEEILLRSIRHQIELAMERDRMKSESKDLYKKHVSNAQHLREFKSLLEKLKLLKVEIYEGYKDGKMSKVEYIKRKEDYGKEIESLTNKINELESNVDMDNGGIKENGQSERMNVYSNITKLTRDLVVNFVDKIFVYDKDSIEIVWSFKDCVLDVGKTEENSKIL